MQEGFIAKQIRRTNRNLLLVNLVMLAIVGLIAYTTSRYYYNYFFGPFPAGDVGSLEEASSADSLEKYFVDITGEEAFETGFTQVTEKRSKYTQKVQSTSTDAYYHLLVLANRLLMVKAEESTPRTRYVGSLISVSDYVDRQVYNDIKKEMGEGASQLFPMMLDATGFRTGGTVGLVFLGFFFLLGLFNLVRLGRRMSDFSLHPIWRSLSQMGDAQTLQMTINEQIQSGDVEKFGRLVTLTRGWLLQSTLFGFRPLSLQHLIWAHKEVTKNKRAFITVSKTYKAILWDRSGKSLEIQGKEKRIDGLLASLAVRAPWALFGWSEELKNTWKTQRQQMIQTVDTRRKSPQAHA